MQRDYIKLVGDEHRKQFGQYFTPAEVARFMNRWVLASGRPTLFDPAFGLGAFYHALPPDQEVDFKASELDPKVIQYWQQRVPHASVEIAEEDYLMSWGYRHSNIVCNPPYMRFQKFLNRAEVFDAFRHELGARLSGYTNTASAFLLKSLAELDGTGRLAYIMPLEFLNTGYGSKIKSKLVSGGHLHSIIRFECEEEVFPDVTTSVGIILYDSSRVCDYVGFYVVNSISELNYFEDMAPLSSVGHRQLDPRAKWLPYFQDTSVEVDAARMVRLSSYGRFSRGIATGANEFFALRPSTAKAKGLMESGECVPCITKSSQINKPVFTATDFDKLVAGDQPVLLFSAGAFPSRGAEEYIKYGESQGYDRRYLTKNRKPWYKTEIREPSPILMGVFSRGGYKVIRNLSKALTLTCFHGFRPNRLGDQFVDHLFLYLASEVGREITSLSVRIYGKSLEKFEPNDVNGAFAPPPQFFSRWPREEVDMAIASVCSSGCVPDWVEEDLMQFRRMQSESVVELLR